MIFPLAEVNAQAVTKNKAIAMSISKTAEICPKTMQVRREDRPN